MLVIHLIFALKSLHKNLKKIQTTPEAKNGFGGGYYFISGVVIAILIRGNYYFKSSKNSVWEGPSAKGLYAGTAAPSEFVKMHFCVFAARSTYTARPT